MITSWTAEAPPAPPLSKLADPRLAIVPTPADSPRFLGPTADGKYALHSGRPARDWSTNPPRELWRIQVGDGWSSCAVVGDYVFTQEGSPYNDYETVTCYDLRDGSPQWNHVDERGYSSSLGGDIPSRTRITAAGRSSRVGSSKNSAAFFFPKRKSNSPTPRV